MLCHENETLTELKILVVNVLKVGFLEAASSKISVKFDLFLFFYRIIWIQHLAVCCLFIDLLQPSSAGIGF